MIINKILTEEECLQRLITAYGDKDSSHATVFRWFIEFRKGPASLLDEGRIDSSNSYQL